MVCDAAAVVGACPVARDRQNDHLTDIPTKQRRESVVGRIAEKQIRAAGSLLAGTFLASPPCRIAIVESSSSRPSPP